MIVFLDIFLMLVIVAAIYFVLIHLYHHRFITADKRIAIDYLPFPVYFGLSNKLPLVVNDKMYELIYEIKGKPLTDTSSDFDCLTDSQLDMSDVDMSLLEQFDGSFFISHKDKIYCIEEKMFANLDDKIIQISGQDITEEYLNLCKLKELNDEIRGQNARLRQYIKDSIEINHQQELLDAKISIHGKFGDCLAMTRHLLKNPDDTELGKKVPGLWQQIIVGFTSTPSDNGIAQKGYEELQRVSKLVGCKINVDGKLPDGSAQPLLVKFLREALNNAIRHANATSMNIEIANFKNDGKVVVYDDGTAAKPFTKMGGGLSSLMDAMEKNGILMSIDNTDRFVITLCFPEGLRD